MSKQILLNPTKADFGQRIDLYICKEVAELTRSAVQRLLQNNHITIGGKSLKKSDKIDSDATICVVLPDSVDISLTAEDLPLQIVYEDNDVIVVNKERGMVVHPAAGNWSGTLVNALMYHCGSRLSGINGELRPGIVHRIDKDTSGLLVVAKNDSSHQFLADQISRHEVKREYEAVVIGAIKEESGTIDKPIGRHKTDRKKMAVVPDGRPSITHYRVLQRFPGYTHVAFQLETGRTHQIRVHMASIGHPIIGDPLYGNPKDRFNYLNGQCLHAAHLTFIHPTTKLPVKFDSPLPDYFLNVIEKLIRLA